MKVCVKCGDTKSLSEFYNHTTSRDGLQSYCKECAKTTQAARAAAQKYLKEVYRAANASLGRLLNPEHNRRSARNRRARLMGCTGRPTAGIDERLLKLQRGKCACGCKRPLGDNFHRDHIIPLALGGDNTDENIQLLRARCNMQKGAKHPIDFMQQRGFLL